MGSEHFVERHISIVEDDQNLSDVPSSQCRALPQSIFSYERDPGSRDKALFLAVQSGGYTLKEVGDYCNVHYSRVSRIMSRAEGKALPLYSDVRILLTLNMEMLRENYFLYLDTDH